MRVLVVTPWYPNGRSPYTGAFVERDVRMLAGEHEVVVAHLVAPQHHDGGPERVVQGGVTVHRFPMRPSKPLDWMAAALRVRALMRGADIVHSQAGTSLWPLSLAFGPIRPRLPWLHTEHSSALVADAGGRGRLTTRLIRRYLYARPHVLVAVSGLLAEALRSFRRGPIIVVPNAVDAPAPPPPRSPGGRLKLVSVGGLIRRKRPDVAVKTLASLRDRGLDAQLTWVGDGPLRLQLEELTAKLGLGDRVLWAGAQPPKSISGFLAAADVFILPTEAETFGVSIAEAIAHGRPVVVGAYGGQVDFVSPQVGELVAGDDPEDYAAAVIRLVERTRALDAEAIAATLGDSFRDESRLRRYNEAYAQAVYRAGRTCRP